MTTDTEVSMFLESIRQLRLAALDVESLSQVMMAFSDSSQEWDVMWSLVTFVESHVMDGYLEVLVSTTPLLLQAPKNG